MNAVRTIKLMRKLATVLRFVENRVKIMAPALNQICVNVNMAMKDHTVKLVNDFYLIRFN